MGKRIAWLDIAKGIGILLVVLGHCLHMEGKAFHLIFSFHMPLFFFLSGYVHSDRDSLPVLMKKKTRSLLRPFFQYFLLGLAATLLVPQWRAELTISGIVKDLYLADPNRVHNSSIWFLVGLYFVCPLFWLVRRGGKNPVWVQLLLLTALYAAGCMYAGNRFSLFGMRRLPLNWDVVPVAVSFYAAGFYVRQGNFLEKLFAPTAHCVTGMVLGAGLTWVIYLDNGYVNLHGLSYGQPVLYFLSGLSGTVCVVCVSMLVSRLGERAPVKRILLFYGRNSLGILGTQSLFIRLYILAMERLLGSCPKLYHFTWKHTFISTVLVGFILCPSVCIAGDLLTKERTKHEANSST